jgi:hypothetical protein
MQRRASLLPDGLEQRTHHLVAGPDRHERELVRDPLASQGQAQSWLALTGRVGLAQAGSLELLDERIHLGVVVGHGADGRTGRLSGACGVWISGRTAKSSNIPLGRPSYPIEDRM